MEQFGEKLSAARRAKGYTQEDLAEKLAVSRTNISRWESGKMTPDLDTVNRLSQILDCDFVPRENAPAEEAADASEAPMLEAEAPPPSADRDRRVRRNGVRRAVSVFSLQAGGECERVAAFTGRVSGSGR